MGVGWQCSYMRLLCGCLITHTVTSVALLVRGCLGAHQARQHGRALHCCTVSSGGRSVFMKRGSQRGSMNGSSNMKRMDWVEGAGIVVLLLLCSFSHSGADDPVKEMKKSLGEGLETVKFFEKSMESNKIVYNSTEGGSLMKKLLADEKARGPHREDVWTLLLKPLKIEVKDWADGDMFYHAWRDEHGRAIRVFVLVIKTRLAAGVSKGRVVLGELPLCNILVYDIVDALRRGMDVEGKKLIEQQVVHVSIESKIGKSSISFGIVFAEEEEEEFVVVGSEEEEEEEKEEEEYVLVNDAAEEKKKKKKDRRENAFHVHKNPPSLMHHMYANFFPHFNEEKVLALKNAGARELKLARRH